MPKKSFLTIISNSTGIILFIVFIGYVVTSFISVAQHSKLPLNAGGLSSWGIVANVLAIVLEVLGPIYVTYFLVQLIGGVLNNNNTKYDLLKVTGTKKVSVIIPIRHTPPKILEETIKGFSEQSYSNFDVWVGDDTPDADLREKYEQICTKYKNINYFYAENNKMKAGMINKVIPQTDGDYIAFFDVDHIPEKDILLKFVAILEQFPEYAFVQAKFTFRNVNSILQIWSVLNYSQIFCSQSARQSFNAVLFIGSVACFRKEILENTPMPEDVLGEDYAISVELMKKKQKGYFLDEIGSSSLLADTLSQQVSQLYRWMQAQTNVFSKYLPDVIKGKLGFKQSIDLVFSSTTALGVTSFYELGVVYALIYIFKISFYRALGMDVISQIALPTVVIVLYSFTLIILSTYFKKSAPIQIKWWHIVVYLIMSGIAVPFLKMGSFVGLINPILPKNRKKKWNYKVPIIKWGIFYSVIGIAFFGLSFYSLFDYLGLVQWWYPHTNYFFLMFFALAFSLTFIAPAMILGKKVFKEEEINEKLFYKH